MKYDLFVSDFDGTLGCNPDYIAKENVEAIKEFERRGGIFTIVTGRSYASIKSICSQYGFGGVIAAFQGASIINLDTDEYLFKGGIEAEKAALVADRLKQDSISAVAWIEDVLYFTERSFYVDIFLADKGVKCERVDDISAAIRSTGKTVNKVCGVLPEEDAEKTMEKYRIFEKEGIIVNSGAKGLMEFVNPQYDKGFAVRFIADYYGVPLKKIITVGDSSNDAGLMSKDWHGVAVGDGNESLKEAADEVTVPFNDNPIKVLLDKYCLND